MHCDPPVHDYRGIGKTRIFGHFSAFFVGYNPRFVVPAGFRCPVTSRYTTIEASGKLVISAICAVFVGYDPRFDVPTGFRCHVSTRLSRHRQNS